MVNAVETALVEAVVPRVERVVLNAFWPFLKWRDALRGVRFGIGPRRGGPSGKVTILGEFTNSCVD